MAGAAEAGLVLVATGGGLATWAALHLRAGAGTLVDDGPYAASRHPMYLGLALALTGLGPALGEPLAAWAGPGFAALAQWRLIPREEARLRARHGGWYSDYAATVRRWL